MRSSACNIIPFSDINSGKKMAMQKPPALPRAQAVSRSAKTSAGYWKERVFRPTYTRDGQQHELPEFSVRIQVGGRREIFALKTPVRAEAAAKARDIYPSPPFERD